MLYIFFKHTPTSQAHGEEFLRRFTRRTGGRDAPTSLACLGSLSIRNALGWIRSQDNGNDS